MDRDGVAVSVSGAVAMGRRAHRSIDWYSRADNDYTTSCAMVVAAAHDGYYLPEEVTDFMDPNSSSPSSSLFEPHHAFHYALVISITLSHSFFVPMNSEE
ncbi:unnamed protein product [Haemonchus placei]|uniref:Uncharacterized protein n=1 Tax=Haemonchus placei TaxID=6290 RepID=A0A0N4WIV1_HAEPC|nr:unnamed protein product [Haemonchus placei]